MRQALRGHIHLPTQTATRLQHHALLYDLCSTVILQDAVALALTFDRALASAVAASAEDDEALQRKLWLAIVRHLIDAASEKTDSDPVCSYYLGSHCLVLLR